MFKTLPSKLNFLTSSSAEFGLGIKLGDMVQKEKIKTIFKNSDLSEENEALVNKWLENEDSIDAASDLINNFVHIGPQTNVCNINVIINHCHSS